MFLGGNDKRDQEMEPDSKARRRGLGKSFKLLVVEPVFLGGE